MVKVSFLQQTHPNDMALSPSVQAALGELTYESEAAERLRGELREARECIAPARADCAAATAAAEAAAQACALPSSMCASIVT